MLKFTLPKKVKQKLTAYFGTVPGELIYVNVADQSLTLLKNNRAVLQFPVSTSRYGIGNQENSFKTPPGIHRVMEKIGHDAPIGRVFRDRIDAGEDCPIDGDDDNMILTRILRLEGLEEGVNRGPGIDSFERYIYIHGTNKERQIGAPMSNGCVCMKNNDVVALFNSVNEGTIVFID